jgi:TIR domain
MNSKVFISYARKDLRVAERMRVDLERRGFPCWIDHRNLELGGDFAEEIVKSIRSCKIFLILLSSHANNSREMPKEIVLADNAGLLVIPVRIEEILPSGAFAFQLATRQWVDLFRDWDSGIERLASRIATVVPPERQPSISAPPRRPAQPAGRPAVSPVPYRNPPDAAPKRAANEPPGGPPQTRRPSWVLIGGMAGVGAMVVAWLIYDLSTPLPPIPQPQPPAARIVPLLHITPSYKVERRP